MHKNKPALQPFREWLDLPSSRSSLDSLSSSRKSSSPRSTLWYRMVLGPLRPRFLWLGWALISIVTRQQLHSAWPHSLAPLQDSLCVSVFFQTSDWSVFIIVGVSGDVPNNPVCWNFGSPDDGLLWCPKIISSSFRYLDLSMCTFPFNPRRNGTKDIHSNENCFIECLTGVFFLGEATWK